MAIEKIIKYRTSNGVLFEDITLAETYENRIMKHDAIISELASAIERFDPEWNIVFEDVAEKMLLDGWYKQNENDLEHTLMERFDLSSYAAEKLVGMGWTKNLEVNK